MVFALGAIALPFVAYPLLLWFRAVVAPQAVDGRVLIEDYRDGARPLDPQFLKPRRFKEIPCEGAPSSV